VNNTICGCIYHCFRDIQGVKPRLVNFSPIGLSSVLRPRQHSIGYMGDGRFLQVNRPNEQYQSTEGDATKEKAKNENN